MAIFRTAYAGNAIAELYPNVLLEEVIHLDWYSIRH